MEGGVAVYRRMVLPCRNRLALFLAERLPVVLFRREEGLAVLPEVRLPRRQTAFLRLQGEGLADSGGTNAGLNPSVERRC